MRLTGKSLIATLLATMFLLLAFTGCASSQSAAATPAPVSAAPAATDAPAESAAPAETAAPEVKVIKVAYEIDGTPFSYQDENGNDTGGDVELLRLVDEYLPEYEFQFTGTSEDDLIVGTTAGTYDIALTNAFYTVERGEKFFVPQENMGGALFGLVVRNENADVKTLQDVYDKGLKLAPQVPGDGRTFQFEQYNEQHPDKQIAIEYTNDAAINNKYYEWVLDGKYDVAPKLKVSWEQQVVAADGASHQYLDKLTFNILKAIKAYPLISRASQNEDFVKEFDEALKKAKADPRAIEISQKFFGDNIWVYPFEEGR